MVDIKWILKRTRLVAETASLPDSGHPDKDRHRAKAREATIRAVLVLVEALERVEKMLCGSCSGSGRDPETNTFCKLCRGNGGDVLGIAVWSAISDALTPLAKKP